MLHRILFVCLGNICRSPSAEAVFRAHAERAGLNVQIDSAGTSDWHVGSPPYALMQDAAGQRGYVLSDLRARQFTTADFEDFDLIIGMDADNVTNMEALRPLGNSTQVKVFTDYAPQTDADHVPDPYYTRAYEEALDLIEAASAGLVKHLSA